ncbi:hypothetical protein, partial [Aeromonas caviae]|uniref:hypothetical protein n=1 Tax=Aeromonas caviae TaxID=648 RepID=UPI0025B63741
MYQISEMRQWLSQKSIKKGRFGTWLVYTSDAADDLACVGVGGRGMSEERKREEEGEARAERDRTKYRH